MHGSATLHIDAAPKDVWALVSDVTRIGEYSPETFEAEWLGGATGPAVGARFRGHVKRNGRGPVYWAPCVVVACEPEREFAFDVGLPKRPMITWRYELEASGGGTDVMESFRLHDRFALRLYWRLLGWARSKTNQKGMQATLERMKAELENA